MFRVRIGKMGNLTAADYRSFEIEYAPGRLTEDGKADEEVKSMERRNVIRRTYWIRGFCSWIKKTVPVTHKVVYQVTDSIGNITEVVLQALRSNIMNFR